jgi:hypothetical protein
MSGGSMSILTAALRNHLDNDSLEFRIFGVGRYPLEALLSLHRS